MVWIFIYHNSHFYLKDILMKKYANNSAMMKISIFNVGTWFVITFIMPDPFLAGCLPVVQIIAYLLIRQRYPAFVRERAG